MQHTPAKERGMKVLSCITGSHVLFCFFEAIVGRGRKTYQFCDEHTTIEVASQNVFEEKGSQIL